jgi:DNA-binding MarR family transcriptional regulator
MLRAYSVQIMNTPDRREDQRLLDLLHAVEQRSDVSQRLLARQMGVALGLANSYLRRCIRKGLIKIATAPANRYLYYLTPKGFSEKSRLTAKYLATSFEFYRRASGSCLNTFSECYTRGWRRVVLCGASDLAEIAALRASEVGITIVDMFDPDAEQQTFLGKPIVRNLDKCEQFDGCVVTDLRAPRQRYERLVAAVGRERVFAPDILGL